MTDDGNSRQGELVVAKMQSYRMRYEVTGEVRVIPEDLEWFDGEDGDSEWFWTEGNFGCDCNRSAFWSRNNPNPDQGEDIDNECGDSRFTILDVTLDDGRVIELEK